jgi:hypothetical protein
LRSTEDLRSRHPDDPYTIVDIPLLFMLRTLFTYPKPPSITSLEQTDSSPTAIVAVSALPAASTTAGGSADVPTSSNIADLQLRALAGLDTGLLNAAARQANLSTEGTEADDGRTEYRRMPGGYTRPST